MSEIEIDSTEEKIKIAARELFLKNGLKGTTIRKVAEKAGVNIALVNYYFRSKNKLFLAVFKEKFKKFDESGYHILVDNSISLEERLNKYIDQYVAVFLEEPSMPIFVLSAAHFNVEIQEALASIKNDFLTKHKAELQQMLDKEFESGKYKRIDIRELSMTIVALLVFPFMAKNIMTKVGEFEHSSFEDFIEHWKNHVKNVVRSSVLI